MAAVGALLLLASAAACEETGKTVPERCSDSRFDQPYDIQTAGTPPDDLPCVTPVGHAVSDITTPGGASSQAAAGTNSTGGTAASGGTAGNGGSAGTSGSGGTSSSGGTATSNAGAGGV